MDEQSTYNWSLWTDRMIANHFGQSKSKTEIEKIVGRKIDWNAVERAALLGVHHSPLP